MNIWSHIVNSLASIAIGALVTHCTMGEAKAQSVPFNAYSVSTLGGNCTAQGSVMVQTSGGKSDCIGAGGNGQVLESGGANADVKWGTVTGTGTVSGPASSAVGNIALWNSTTGTAISDSGVSLPAGAIVGTTDTQALTNKTLTSAVINGATISGGSIDAGALNPATIGNGLSVSGDVLSNSGVTGLGGMSGQITCGNSLTCAGGSIVSHEPYVQLSDFGIVCDGTTDFHSQLQTAINASVGTALFIPATGLPCVTSTTLNVPSNVTIIGGGFNSILEGKGSALPILNMLNASNVHLADFWLKGSDSATDWSVTQYGAFSFIFDASLAADAVNDTVIGMKFSGFNTNYWFGLDASNATHNIDYFTFSRNYVDSENADIPTADPSTGNARNWSWVSYGGRNGQAEFYKPSFNNNYIDAKSLCIGIALYDDTRGAIIHGNFINGGGIDTPSHCNNTLSSIDAYGILLYNTSNNTATFGPREFIISDNKVESPLSAGIYLQSQGTLGYGIVSDNIIEGQTASDDTSLPRAGIAVNGMSNLSISGNQLFGNFYGISEEAQQSGAIQNVGNFCNSGLTGGCIKFSPSASSTISYFNYANTLVSNSTSTAIKCLTSSSNAIADLVLNGNSINAFGAGISCADGFINNITSNGNSYFENGGSTLVDFSGNNGVINLGGDTFNGLFTATSILLKIDNDAALNVVGEKFDNYNGSSQVFSAINSCGNLSGISFSNIASGLRVAATSLGTTNPNSCALSQGDFVQNLLPAELGAAGTKYVVEGWQHVTPDTTNVHVESRVLTGE